MPSEMFHESENITPAIREPLIVVEGREVRIVGLNHGTPEISMSAEAQQIFSRDTFEPHGANFDYILPDSFGPKYVSEYWRGYVNSPSRDVYGKVMFDVAIKTGAMIVPSDFRLDGYLYPHLKAITQINAASTSRVTSKPPMSESEIQQEIQRILPIDPDFRSQYEVWTALENNMPTLQTAVGVLAGAAGLAVPWVLQSMTSRVLDTLKRSAQSDSVKEGIDRKTFISLALGSIVSSIAAGKLGIDQVPAFIHDRKKAFLARYGLTSTQTNYRDVEALITKELAVLGSSVEITDTIRSQRGFQFLAEVYDAHASTDFTTSIGINSVFAEAVSALPRRNGGANGSPERVLVALGYLHLTTRKYRMSQLLSDGEYRYQAMKASFDVMVRAIKEFFPDRKKQEVALAEFKAVLKTPVVPFQVLQEGGKLIKQPGPVIPLPRVVELADRLAL